MTYEEKLDYMRVMGGSDVADETDDVLRAYLQLAEQKLLDHIYPFGRGKVVNIPNQYDTKQIELALILYSKRGAEGEDSHSENGVSRKYTSEEKFLASIPRKVGLPL